MTDYVVVPQMDDAASPYSWDDWHLMMTVLKQHHLRHWVIVVT